MPPAGKFTKRAAIAVLGVAVAAVAGWSGRAWAEGPASAPEATEDIAELRARYEREADAAINGGKPVAKSLQAPKNFSGLDIASHPKYRAAIIAGLKAPTVEVPLAGDGPRMKSIGGIIISNVLAFRSINVLYSSIGKDPICSAVLLDARTVLTAGHCACWAVPGQKLDRTNFGLSVGDDHYRPELVVDKVIPGLDCGKLDSTLPGHDIGIMKLRTPVPADWDIKAQPLPDHDATETVASAEALYVVGYGHTSWNFDDAGDVKSMVRVPVFSATCSDSVDGIPESEKYKCVPGREILALDPKISTSGPCPGDSGGGVFFEKVGAGGKTYHLVGIVSRSIPHENPNARKCGDGAIFTLLTREHINWIKSVSAAEGGN